MQIRVRVTNGKCTPCETCQVILRTPVTRSSRHDHHASGWWRAAENATVSNGGLRSSTDAHSVLDRTYCWPLIEEDSIEAVKKQLQNSVSIYDNGKIFGKLEGAWKERHEFGNKCTSSFVFRCLVSTRRWFARNILYWMGYYFWSLSKFTARSYSLYITFMQPALQLSSLVLSRFTPTLWMMVTSLRKLCHLLLRHWVKIEINNCAEILNEYT